MNQNLIDAAKAATKKVGADLVSTMCNAFGATNGRPDDVPESRQVGLTAALTKLVSGAPITMAMAKIAAHGDPAPRRATVSAGESVFRSIRADAFGTADDDDDDAAATPKSISDIHVQAYARWNRARAKTE